MHLKRSFAVIGGDLRQRCLLRQLRGLGFPASAYRVPDAEDSAPDLSGSLRGANVLILPMPAGGGVPLADILAHPAPESLLLPVDTLFAAHPALTLTPAQEKCCRNGASFTLCFAPGRYRLYAESGEFLALGEVRDGRMETVKSFFAI